MRRRAFDHVNPNLAPAWSDPPEPTEADEHALTGRELYELVFGPSRHWGRFNTNTRDAWDRAAMQLRYTEQREAA